MRTKPCKQCGAERPAEHGRQFCAACSLGRQRARTFESEKNRRENDPTYRVRQARYQRNKRSNPIEAAAHCERSCAWARNNRDKAKTIIHRRKARLRDNSSPGVTAEQWQEILVWFDNRCAYCLRSGLPLEREHVIPIARGGRDEPSNVIPACERCNCSKNASILPIWYARQLNEARL